MPKIIIEGHEVDATPEVILTWAMGVFIGSFDIVGGIYTYQQMGNPEFGRKNFIDVLQRILVQMEENDKVVDDHLIQDSIDAMLPGLRQFINSSSIFYEWHEKHLTDDILKVHEEMISFTGSFYLPEWANSQEYQVCLQTSSDAYTAYLDGLEVAIRNIEDIYSQFGLNQYYDQLEKVRGQIPDARKIIEEGFVEAIRRNADQIGGAKSA